MNNKIILIGLGLLGLYFYYKEPKKEFVQDKTAEEAAALKKQLDEIAAANKRKLKEIEANDLKQGDDNTIDADSLLVINGYY